MHHNRRAKACLVGEHAALKSLRHGLLDQYTDTAADKRRGGECKLEDRAKHCADLRDIAAENDERADDVSNRHKGYDDLCHASDALQTADDDQRTDDKQYKTDDQMDNINARAGDGAQRNVREECGVHIEHDLVDLRHVTDTEGCKDGKAGEQHCQHACGDLQPLFAVTLAKTVGQIVHRAARPLAVLIAAAVVDAQQVFREVGHHAKECGNPHPEHGTRATGYDGSGNACDIARAHRGGKRGAQRLELRNGFGVGLFGGRAVLFEHACNGLLPPMPCVGDLEHAGSNGQQNARANQQNESGQTPDRAVDGVVDVCDDLDKLVHDCISSG